MKNPKGTFISAIPALKPTQVIDKKTGELIQEWETTVNSLLSYVRSETVKEYDLTKDHIHDTLKEGIRGNPAEYARQHNIYSTPHTPLPRLVKAQSRIQRLIRYKLVSEVGSYTLNPDPRKQEPTFNTTINLGACDKQMCYLEMSDDITTLWLHWKIWDKELVLVFDLPSYLQGRTILKVSLPVVRLNRQGTVVFQFSILEKESVRVSSELSAGVDLGRVEPYTMSVTNSEGKRVAHYKSTRRTTQIARKQERLTQELKSLSQKIRAYEGLGLDVGVLEVHRVGVRNKRTRLTNDLAWRVSDDIHSQLRKHAVKVLFLEDLSWVHGAKYGSRWAHSKQSEAIVHKAKREGTRVRKISPKNSSRLCSECDGSVRFDSRSRVVKCVVCGFQSDRDVNASLRLSRGNKARFPGSKRAIGGDCTLREVVGHKTVSTSAVKVTLLTRNTT